MLVDCLNRCFSGGEGGPASEGRASQTAFLFTLAQSLMLECAEHMEAWGHRQVETKDHGTKHWLHNKVTDDYWLTMLAVGKVS